MRTLCFEPGDLGVRVVVPGSVAVKRSHIEWETTVSAVIASLRLSLENGRIKGHGQGSSVEQLIGGIFRPAWGVPFHCNVNTRAPTRSSKQQSPPAARPSRSRLSQGSRWCRPGGASGVRPPPETRWDVILHWAVFPCLYIQLNPSWHNCAGGGEKLCFAHINDRPPRKNHSPPMPSLYPPTLSPWLRYRSGGARPRAPPAGFAAPLARFRIQGPTQGPGCRDLRRGHPSP